MCCKLILRFEQHLPYYRIEQLYARAGVPLSRQTLSGWAGMGAAASSLIIAATKEEVFADGYVQVDETPIKYQDPERKGVCGTGYFWVFHNPVRNLSYFVWRTGRGTACLESIVPADFKGIIQCDGYSAYPSFAKQRALTGMPIQLAGCLAHVRRKFFEAKAEGEDSAWFLLWIQKLYQIEARLRDCRAGPDTIRSERQTHSLPLLTQIKIRLDDLLARRKHLPQSLTGQALTYALGQWDKLLVYLTDGRVQIDNNFAYAARGINQIVVDFDASVVQIGVHAAEGIAGVLEGLAKTAFGQVPAAGLEQVYGFFQPPQDGPGHGGTGRLAQDGPGFVFAELFLKLIEVGHLPDDPSGPDRGFVFGFDEPAPDVGKAGGQFDGEPGAIRGGIA